MIEKQRILFLLVFFLSVIFLSSCSKDQKIADKYSHIITDRIKQIKLNDEFFQPDKEIVLEFLKDNEDKIPIENISVRIDEGTIIVEVNGKIGKAIYQTTEEYKSEKRKYAQVLKIGPVVKGFYLGMKKDDVINLVQKSFPTDAINKYKFKDFLVKKNKDSDLFNFVFSKYNSEPRVCTNWLQFESGQEEFGFIFTLLTSADRDLVSAFVGEHSFFLFDKDNELIDFQIGKNDVKHLFNSGEMSLNQFTQNFVNNYRFIKNMKPFYYPFTDVLYLIAAVSGSQNGYMFESDYGWEIKIFYTDNFIFDQNRVYDSKGSEAVAIRLTKKKSVSETKFGD